MTVLISSLSIEDAYTICSWKYSDEYAVYNMPEWEIVQQEKWAIADLKRRQKEFWGLFEKDELIGFFRAQKMSTYVLLGLGLKPDLCGKGLGKNILNVILDFVCAHFAVENIIVEVRSFNIRAIKCYKSCGFIVDGALYNKEINRQNISFIKMQYSAAPSGTGDGSQDKGTVLLSC